jgi:hypothetical protein
MVNDYLNKEQGTPQNKKTSKQAESTVRGEFKNKVGPKKEKQSCSELWST